MEESCSEKPLPGGEARSVQQCLTDIFTSVYTTCDIPENAIFGPCVLSHTSLYDSIAFIALKCTDKRTTPYAFRVDTSSAGGSAEGSAWLRLVQAARTPHERNLEAYVKSGQLYYRSERTIHSGEELLVWYGTELMELLLGSDRTADKHADSPPHQCPDCNQRFQFEFPFLAHLRFRCPNKPAGGEIGDGRPAESPRPGHAHSQDTKPATDFHNLARDVEAQTRGEKRKLRLEFEKEAEEGRDLPRPPVSKEEAAAVPGERKRSAFREVKKAHPQTPPGSPRPSAASAFTPLSLCERKSAFIPPSRCFPQLAPSLDTHPKLQGAELSAVKHSPFLYAAAAAAAFWPKASVPVAVPLQVPSALALLPPSFTSLCLPAQNWCAKCNASFRMTSDLVYHMRSHHKKELGGEPLVRRRREEKLRCPICNESFRERHHLSRHMTSHN